MTVRSQGTSVLSHRTGNSLLHSCNACSAVSHCLVTTAQPLCEGCSASTAYAVVKYVAVAYASLTYAQTLEFKPGRQRSSSDLACVESGSCTCRASRAERRCIRASDGDQENEREPRHSVCAVRIQGRVRSQRPHDRLLSVTESPAWRRPSRRHPSGRHSPLHPHYRACYQVCTSPTCPRSQYTV